MMRGATSIRAGWGPVVGSSGANKAQLARLHRCRQTRKTPLLGAFFVGIAGWQIGRVGGDAAGRHPAVVGCSRRQQKRYWLPGIQNTATAVFPLALMPNMLCVGDSLFSCVPAPAKTPPRKAQIMIGQGVVGIQEEGSKHDIYHAAANLVNGDEYGTLILDGGGRIRSCGAVGERIFGASQVRLVGRPICEFIAGLSIGGSSPSYCARYLIYLCRDGAWRRVQAVDAHGCEFAVELNLSRVMTGGREMFVLNLRRAEGPNGA